MTIKRLTQSIIITLSVSQVFASTCGLNTDASLNNPFKMDNPFTACDVSLNVRGLPNIWDDAFDRLGQMGDDLISQVCSSVQTDIDFDFEGVYDDIVSDVGEPDPPDEGDISEYCERHPNMCPDEEPDPGDGSEPGDGSNWDCLRNPHLCDYDDNPIPAKSTTPGRTTSSRSSASSNNQRSSNSVNYFDSDQSQQAPSSTSQKEQSDSPWGFVNKKKEKKDSPWSFVNKDKKDDDDSNE